MWVKEQLHNILFSYFLFFPVFSCSEVHYTVHVPSDITPDYDIKKLLTRGVEG